GDGEFARVTVKKSEGRIPKSERRPNSEIRRGSVGLQIEIRDSSFFRHSDFEFRISSARLSQRSGHDATWVSGLSFNYGRNGASTHNGDTIAHAEHFWQIAGNHQHGQAVFREPADNSVDF